MPDCQNVGELHLFELNSKRAGPGTESSMSKELAKSPSNDENLRPLLGSLRELIAEARQQVLRAVDVIQVQTCWEIGRHIVEFEQNGAARAEYGKRLLPALAAALMAEFGKGFDATNLRHMRGFFLAFPIRDALRRELSWTHYRTLLRVETDQARQWYMNEAANQGWTTRALDRQLGTLYYERLLASSDRAATEQEALANLTPLQQTPSNLCVIRSCWNSWDCPAVASCWKAIWNRRCSITCRTFCWDLAKASPSSHGSNASVRSRRTSLSTWSFINAAAQAKIGRARPPCLRRGACGRAKHVLPMVRSGHSRIVEPHGHAHRTGHDLECATGVYPAPRA
jgi:hypothetical protein